MLFFYTIDSGLQTLLTIRRAKQLNMSLLTLLIIVQKSSPSPLHHTSQVQLRHIEFRFARAKANGERRVFGEYIKNGLGTINAKR